MAKLPTAQCRQSRVSVRARTVALETKIMFKLLCSRGVRSRTPVAERFADTVPCADSIRS